MSSRPPTRTAPSGALLMRTTTLGPASMSRCSRAGGRTAATLGRLLAAAGDGDGSQKALITAGDSERVRRQPFRRAQRRLPRLPVGDNPDGLMLGTERWWKRQRVEPDLCRNPPVGVPSMTVSAMLRPLSENRTASALHIRGKVKVPGWAAGYAQARRSPI